MLTPELVATVRLAAQQHEPRLHEVADVLDALVAASPTAQPDGEPDTCTCGCPEAAHEMERDAGAQSCLGCGCKAFVARPASVRIPLSVAITIDKVFCPRNPNKMRGAHPDVVKAAHVFKRTVAEAAARSLAGERTNG